MNEERIKLDAKKKPIKDVAWQVDQSWEWQSSDEEELTNSIQNNENLSTKYRRYSCKYILESGVESDSDGELNEDGLQSMLNDNVKLDGINSNGNEMITNGTLNGDDKIKLNNNQISNNKIEKTNKFTIN